MFRPGIPAQAPARRRIAGGNAVLVTAAASLLVLLALLYGTPRNGPTVLAVEPHWTRNAALSAALTAMAGLAAPEAALQAAPLPPAQAVLIHGRAPAGRTFPLDLDAGGRTGWTATSVGRVPAAPWGHPSAGSKSGLGSLLWLCLPALPLLGIAAAFSTRRPHPPLAFALAPGIPSAPLSPVSPSPDLSLPTVLMAQSTAPADTQRSTASSSGPFGGFPGVGGIASVATVAAQEVSKAVSMRRIEAPELEKTYLVLDDTEGRRGRVDDSGLPLVYDKALIQKYWERQGGALQQRWNDFLGCTIPFLTRIVALGLSGGSSAIQAQSASLARDARQNLERLGPTYIKMGQMLSVRPDVLPKEALDELAVLQDSVKPFPTDVAVRQIERELKQPLGAVFREISAEPVAAASLAQVYKAVTLDGRVVAVKVQRPDVLELVSKDLYVLRRAAEVYQGLMDRFVPKQRTDYVALLNEWAVGFYTELDFFNEARNQMRLKKSLLENGVTQVYIPEVYEELCTRRVLVSEWIDGVKLSACDPQEIRELIAVGQEAFLMQLLQIGFFHCDPHPGNLLRMNDQSKGRLALLDCGLMASVQQEDMDTFVSAVIHLSNRDYKALVDDFIQLGILPPDCNRGLVEPLMDKALTPYVKGGGAKAYEAELKRMYGMDGSTGAAVGGFQAMTGDMLTVLNDIPFTIPPYMALLARAVVTLEGIALRGNPSYGIVTEAYPFVARKLLREDRPEIQRALVDLLYGGGPTGAPLQLTRLAVVLNGAMGVVARGSGAFVDFDTLPDDSVGAKDVLKYLLSPGARSLRDLLRPEALTAADLLLRQLIRLSFRRLENALAPPAFLRFLPNPTEAPVPFLLPSLTGAPTPALLSPRAVVDAAAPALDRNEEVYALSLVDLAKGVLGADAAAVLTGEAWDQPQAVARLLLSLLTTGRPVGSNDLQAAAATAAQAVGPAPGGDQPVLRELQDALRGLGTEEQEALRQMAVDLATQLWGRLVGRVSSLGQGPARRVDPVAI